MHILAESELVSQFLDVLDGVSARVAGERTGLSDGIDMTHVADGGRDVFVLVFDEGVDLFISGVVAGHQVVLVEVGVIGSSWVEKVVPNPLKSERGTVSNLCRFLVTARICNINRGINLQLMVK